MVNIFVAVHTPPVSLTVTPAGFWLPHTTCAACPRLVDKSIVTVTTFAVPVSVAPNSVNLPNISASEIVPPSLVPIPFVPKSPT